MTLILVMNYYRVGASEFITGQLRLSYSPECLETSPELRFYDEKQKHWVQMVFNCLETHYGRLVIVSHKK